MIRLKVRELAQQQNISQSRLGRLADIDAPRMRQIWRYGDSHHTNITLTTLDRLAKALHVDASELIESVPDSEPEEN